MGLFEPKWMHKNEDKALSYVEQLQDESKLISAALDSPHDDVCMAAARKLKSDDALLRVMKGTDLRGKRKNQIITEMINKLQDKSRLKEYVSDPELIIRYYALKYNGQEGEAFETLKKEADRGENFATECFVDDLSIDELCNLLVTTQCGSYFAKAIIEHLKKVITDKEEFENIICDIATQTENHKVRTCASWELSLPRVVQRYNTTMKAKELRKQSEEEERERKQKQREEEKKRIEIKDNKQRFLSGEKLSRDDERDVVKNLTVEDIKDAGLTIPMFERLLEHADDQFIIDVLVGLGETYAVKAIVDRYLLKWLNEKDKYNNKKIGNHTHTAAKMLVALYRNGVCADKIKKSDGMVLQQAGKMPDFDMSDPMEREMATGYSPDPEIRFDLSDDYGLNYIFQTSSQMEKKPARSQGRSNDEAKRVAELRKIGMQASGSKLSECVKELHRFAETSGKVANDANLALRDIALNNSNAGWEVLEIDKYITDNKIKSDPKYKSRVEEVKRYSDEFDRLMTAQDSGVGRST